MLLRFACQCCVSAGGGQYSHHKIIVFGIFEGFLQWGTLYTERGEYSLVNNVRGDSIHFDNGF